MWLLIGGRQAGDALSLEPEPSPRVACGSTIIVTTALSLPRSVSQIVTLLTQGWVLLVVGANTVPYVLLLCTARWREVLLCAALTADGMPSYRLYAHCGVRWQGLMSGGIIGAAVWMDTFLVAKSGAHAGVEH